jgi:hypothetical protein
VLFLTAASSFANTGKSTGCRRRKKTEICPSKSRPIDKKIYPKTEAAYYLEAKLESGLIWKPFERRRQDA